MNPSPSSGLWYRQSWNDRIEISGGGSDPSAAYRFGNQPKACVHPLLTPSGRCLSGFQMSDHIWHRGLWFTIKLLNGVNFWEENNPPFGAQNSVGQPQCELIEANALRVNHVVDWTSQTTGVAFHERRSVIFRFAADGIGTIDWSTHLIAAQDLVLDRTPFTTWGGYGGLSFRSSRELHDVQFMAPGGETVSAMPGISHDWVIMQGAVDGGLRQYASLGMIDHPSNPRSPCPWYCKAGNGFNFMNAAFLFHEPMNVVRNQSLDFRYRIHYRDGTWTAHEFAALADAFRKS